MNDTDSGRPLTGIRVVELAGIGPAPLACTMLASMGCDVVRIERLVQSANSLDNELARIAVRERPTIGVDLKSEKGKQVVAALIEDADVLIEGFRPGTTERLGIGPERFVESNPGLVYVRLTGWGQEGPYAAMAGHDINYIGLSGALAAIGTEERPIPPLNLLGDYAGGTMFALIGALAALVERDRTGRGAVVDAAMIDGVSSLLTPIRDLASLGAWIERRSANMLDGGAPFYRTYETSDGLFMAVGALEPAFYSAFVVGLGIDEEDLPNRFDPDSWETLSNLFADIFATGTRDHWQSVYDGTDACVTPVLGMAETAMHPQNRARPEMLSPAPFDSGTATDVLMRAGVDLDEFADLVDEGIIEVR